MGSSVGSECSIQREEHIPRIKDERNETGGIKVQNVSSSFEWEKMELKRKRRLDWREHCQSH